MATSLLLLSQMIRILFTMQTWLLSNDAYIALISWDAHILKLVNPFVISSCLDFMQSAVCARFEDKTLQHTIAWFWPVIIFLLFPFIQWRDSCLKTASELNDSILISFQRNSLLVYPPLSVVGAFVSYWVLFLLFTMLFLCCFRWLVWSLTRIDHPVVIFWLFGFQ